MRPEVFMNNGLEIRLKKKDPETTREGVLKSPPRVSSFNECLVCDSWRWLTDQSQWKCPPPGLLWTPGSPPGKDKADNQSIWCWVSWMKGTRIRLTSINDFWLSLLMSLEEEGCLQSLRQENETRKYMVSCEESSCLLSFCHRWRKDGARGAEKTTTATRVEHVRKRRKEEKEGKEGRFNRKTTSNRGIQESNEKEGSKWKKKTAFSPCFTACLTAFLRFFSPLFFSSLLPSSMSYFPWLQQGIKTCAPQLTTDLYADLTDRKNTSE